MTAATSKLLRVRRGRPCPICGKADWCSVSADGGVAICMRVASDRPTRNGGWIHRLDGKAAQTARQGESERDAAPKLSTAELVLLDRRFRADLTAGRLVWLAERLCVSASSLRAFGIGWSHEKRAFTFPMRDAGGRTIGFRTRHLGGEKRCIAGSRLGPIVPDAPASLATGWLLVCEGESDAAAAFDFGFDAIGRPGCESCRAIIVERVARLPSDLRIAIVADADAAGQRGGHTLARAIAQAGRRVRVLTLPGAKDVRAFKATAGGTHHDLLALVEAPAARAG